MQDLFILTLFRIILHIKESNRDFQNYLNQPKLMLSYKFTLIQFI